MMILGKDAGDAEFRTARRHGWGTWVNDDTVWEDKKVQRKEDECILHVALELALGWEWRAGPQAQGPQRAHSAQRCGSVLFSEPSD